MAGPLMAATRTEVGLGPPALAVRPEDAHGDRRRPGPRVPGERKRLGYRRPSAER